MKLLTTQKDFTAHIAATVLSVKELRQRIHVECVSALSQIYKSGSANWFNQIGQAYMETKGIDVEAINKWLMAHSGYEMSYNVKTKKVTTKKGDTAALLELTPELFASAKEHGWYEQSNTLKMLSVPKAYGQSFVTAISRLMALGNETEDSLVAGLKAAIKEAREAQDKASEWVDTYRTQQNDIAAAKTTKPVEVDDDAPESVTVTFDDATGEAVEFSDELTAQENDELAALLAAA